MMNHVKQLTKTNFPAPAGQQLTLSDCIQSGLNGGFGAFKDCTQSKKNPAPSDRRLKRNVAALRDALGKLLRLRGVTFEYNETGQKRGCPAGARMGMIAQEVEEVIPEWVQMAGDGYRELAIDGFEALTVEALRELKAENDQLRGEIAELRGFVQELLEERRPVFAET
jgi:hypothetical protein